jgi:UPF0716 protein FxsA
MLGRLLLLFLLTPAIELGLLIQVDRLIGFGPTIGLIVVTGIAGSYLARREGLNTWRRLNERLNAGDLPGTELIDGVIILMAGALLVTPGVLTDVIGFLGLLPPTRALIRRLVMRRFRRKIEEGSFQVQLGFFGGAAPGPNDAPPDGGPGPAGSSPTDQWQGTPRQVPSHGDDAEEPGADATSGRSNGR